MGIGGHISAAGGLEKVVPRALERGFTAIQLFASPPQGYKPISYTKEAGEAFHNEWQKAGIHSVFFHAIYLLNLASEKPFIVHSSKQSLIDYMNFGHYAGTTGTIFHVGSVKNDKFTNYKSQIVEAMKEVIEKTPEDQYLIMENAAGGGGRVGVSIEELSALFHGVNSDRLKICLDTQHLWGSGINVANREEFRIWLETFDKEIGCKNVVCLHVNDSKVPFDSKKDRHENIGEGSIGFEGLKNALTQPLLQGKPLILEVSGMDDEGPDKENKERVERLLNSNSQITQIHK